MVAISDGQPALPRPAPWNGFHWHGIGSSDEPSRVNGGALDHNLLQVSEARAITTVRPAHDHTGERRTQTLASQYVIEANATEPERLLEGEV